MKNTITNIINELLGKKFFQDPLGFMEEHCCYFEEKEKLIKKFTSTYHITASDPNGHNKIREFFDAIEYDNYEYLNSIRNYSPTFCELDEEEQEEVLDTLCGIMLQKIKNQLENIYEEKYKECEEKL